MTFVPIWFLSYNAQDGDSGCFIHACHVNTGQSKLNQTRSILYGSEKLTHERPIFYAGRVWQVKYGSSHVLPPLLLGLLQVVWFRQWIENDFWACLGYCHKCQWYFENIMRLIWNDNFLIKSFPKLKELLWYGGKMI